MEQDKKIPDPKDLVSKQRVGGYGVGNLLSSSIFMSKNKNVMLSFEIYDILTIDGEEIMKLAFPRLKNMIVRIMKYTTENKQPAAIFDIVNIATKEIVLTGEQEFIGGVGMDKIFFEGQLITQWEIPVFSKLCRAFVLGDVEAIEILMKDYYLKFSDESAVRLSHRLGIKL